MPYTPACFSTFYQSTTDVPITVKIPNFLLYLYYYKLDDIMFTL